MTRTSASRWSGLTVEFFDVAWATIGSTTSAASITAVAAQHLRVPHAHMHVHAELCQFNEEAWIQAIKYKMWAILM